MSPRLAVLLSVLAGALLAVQARVNGALTTTLGSAVPAATVSFAVGTLAVAIAVLTLRAGPPAIAALRRARPPLWQLLGGLGGAFLVGISAYAVPLVGVAFLSVCTVAGQTAGGLGVDRAGLGPGGRRLLTLPRAAGAALAVVALLVAAAGHRGQARPVLFGLIALAGVGVALQQAANGRLGVASGQPAFASLVSFLGGTAALLGTSLALAATGRLDNVHWPGLDRGWLYLGGIGGGVYITLSAFAVPVLGVLRLSLASIAGQLAGGVVIDIVTPSGEGLEPLTVVAVLLTFVAVALAGRVPAALRAQPAVPRAGLR